MTSRGAASGVEGGYQTFWVEISASGRGQGQYQARVLRSPAAEGRTLFSRPLDEAALDALTSAFDAARERNFQLDDAGDAAGEAGETSDEVLQRLGEELFDNLFSGELGSLWARSLGTGERPPAPLRLLLQMQLDDAATARLHALPWECLRPPGEGLPLLLDPDFSLVRYLSQPGTPELPPAPPRLRVLAVSADVADGELAPLDLERELDALAATGVDLAVERDLPFEQLDDALREHRPHALHFLGHGGFRSAEGGVLYFRDAGGVARPLDPEALARCLKPCASLRLVFLNACVTARAAHRAPFAGVATGLIRKARVPAVLAMQRPVSDAAAARFAAEVYRQLAAGVTLDRAVSEGRRRLRGTEWATPTLFSRLPDGRLFAPAEPEAAPMEAASDGRAARSPARWAGWVAALALVLTLLLAGMGLWPLLESGPPTGETHEAVSQQGLLDQPAKEGSEESEEPRPESEATEGDAEPSDVVVSPITPPPATSPPPLYHLQDGGRVYLRELDVFLSAHFNDPDGFVYPTLDLSTSDVSRAVERPRTVVFPTADGPVRLEVISIDLEGRSLTVLPEPADAGETAG